MGLKKYVIAGDIIETYEYEKYIKGSGGARQKGFDNEEKSIENYLKHTVSRRDMIRRLACSNFEAKKDKFLTLTFDDKKVSHDIRNVQECNLVFKNFIKRLKYKLNIINLKYLAVVEFQDANKRGAVHYHVLLNIDYVPVEELQDIWGQGIIFIEQISHVDNLGAYVIKYMTKENSDERLRGEKAYLHSSNLIKPKEIINHDLKNFKKSEYKLLFDYNLRDKYCVYTSEYNTDILGKCTYKQYNLRRANFENY